MIEKKDFMKDYTQMSPDEQQSYIERVEKWNDETFPQLMAEATSWLNVPVKEFNEGLKLVSAIKRARPFVMAHRSYKQVDVVLTKMRSLLVEVQEKSGRSRLRTIPAGDTRKWFAATEVRQAPDEDGVVKVKRYEEPEVDGMRPQHVSEYIHLLPKDLQAEASQLKQMHMELAMYRGEAEELSKNPAATKEQVAEKARRAVDTEQRIRTLYATLDAAWKKQAGKALTADEESLLAPAEEPIAVKRLGEYTKAEIDAMPEGNMKDNCTAARQETNKKYLRRVLKTVTDEYKDQLRLRVSELQQWGIEITDKMKDTLNEVGVIIEGVNDVVVPTPIVEVPVKEQADLFGAEPADGDADSSVGKVAETDEDSVGKVTEE